MRLLKLPEPWQKRVISQEITATHARELGAGYVTPAVLEELRFFREIGKYSVSDFRHEILQAVRRASKPVTMGHGHCSDYCSFRIPADKREALDIRDVPNTWGSGKSQRAFNVALWNQLDREAKRKQREKTKNKPKPAK